MNNKILFSIENLKNALKIPYWRLACFGVLCGLLIGLNAEAQDEGPGGGLSADAAFNESYQLRQRVVIPPGPNAASLGQFGQYEVSKFTGALNKTIPIHTLQGKGIQHNISLSYNGSGAKVEALPSWVGLGWNLNAGGVITRVVKGNPDSKGGALASYHKYYNEVPFAEQLQGMPDPHPDRYELYQAVESGEIEIQPDEFQLNAGGLSATFIITPNGRIITKKRTGLKITPFFGGTGGTNI
ncbi:MAG: hypothetical protein ACPGXL_09905, partial [Chitinophagales bacterium]